MEIKHLKQGILHPLDENLFDPEKIKTIHILYIQKLWNISLGDITQ